VCRLVCQRQAVGARLPADLHLGGVSTGRLQSASQGLQALKQPSTRALPRQARTCRASPAPPPGPPGPAPAPSTRSSPRPSVAAAACGMGFERLHNIPSPAPSACCPQALAEQPNRPQVPSPQSALPAPCSPCSARGWWARPAPAGRGGPAGRRPGPLACAGHRTAAQGEGRGGVGWGGVGWGGGIQHTSAWVRAPGGVAWRSACGCVAGPARPGRQQAPGGAGLFRPLGSAPPPSPCRRRSPRPRSGWRR
jgi:hypothetical protein